MKLTSELCNLSRCMYILNIFVYRHTYNLAPIYKQTQQFDLKKIKTIHAS